MQREVVYNNTILGLFSFQIMIHGTLKCYKLKQACELIQANKHDKIVRMVDEYSE